MYDVVVIGGGVSGSALAATMGQSGRRTLLIERDLRPPKTFVGEWLQPGGLAALQSLGLSHVTEGLDAQPVRGFAIVHRGQGQCLRYPKRCFQGQDESCEGVSFRHGRFVAKLRESAQQSEGVSVIEGTVTSLIEEAGRVRGAMYRDRSGNTHHVRGRLVVIADGRNSLVRRNLVCADKPRRLSFSVGVLLTNVSLPYPHFGNVFVADDALMLAYQIESNAVRCLIDVPGELPSARSGKLAARLRQTVAPNLPSRLQERFLAAIDEQPLKAMPNYVLPCRPHRQPGLIIIGDALNMRHPLTGSGMTVALNDVRLIHELMANVSLRDTQTVDRQIKKFYRSRRPLALTVDMLSGALYEVLRAKSPGLEDMRSAMFNYWKLGGIAVNGPMSLLSGLTPRPELLLWHYGAVTALGVMNQLFSTPRQSSSPTGLRSRFPGPSNLAGAWSVAASSLRTLRPRIAQAIATR